MASSSPLSLTCFSPRASMIASALPSPRHMASNTCLAILPEMLLSRMRAIRPPRSSAETGLAPISSSLLFSWPSNSTCTQLAAILASPQLDTTASK